MDTRETTEARKGYARRGWYTRGLDGKGMPNHNKHTGEGVT
jgi:hypothetical protein